MDEEERNAANEADNLPDFDLNDEAVRLRIAEVAGFLRGVHRYDPELFGGRDLCREDAYTCSTILLRSGMLGSLDELWEEMLKLASSHSHARYMSGLKADENGKIIELELGPYLRGDINFRIPFEINNLDKLEVLTVRGTCVSLPENLSNLQTLRKLVFADFRMATNRNNTFPFPPRIHKIESGDFSSEEATEEAEYIIASIKAHTASIDGAATKPAFLDSLKVLTITSAALEDHHLETVVFDLLPFLPNLTTLSFAFNRIHSFKSIAERLMTADAVNLPIPHGLRTLDISANLVLNLEPVCLSVGFFFIRKRSRGVHSCSSFPRFLPVRSRSLS
jgi:hypothetical protein